MFALAIGFAVWALTSCVAPEPYPETVGERISRGVVRWEDEKAGVVCWTFYSGGISCLPISETLIGRE
jgi:hypothetical protein